MTKKKKTSLKPKVISFRLTTAQNRQLCSIFEREPVSCVKSANRLARKILCDFLAGRLDYADPAHRRIDADAHETAAA